jgi:hypothetical protein
VRLSIGHDGGMTSLAGDELRQRRIEAVVEAGDKAEQGNSAAEILHRGR